MTTDIPSDPAHGSLPTGMQAVPAEGWGGRRSLQLNACVVMNWK